MPARRYIVSPQGGGIVVIPRPAVAASAISSSQIQLTFSYTGPPSLLSYTWYWALSSGGPWNLGGSTTLSSVTDSGLSPSTQYFFYVQAQTTQGSSPNSLTTSATTQAGVSPPSAPPNFVVTGTTISTVGLSWGASTAGTYPVSVYNLQRSLDNVNWTPVVTQAGLTYTDTGLLPGITYYYRVDAQDTIGTTSSWSTLTATTLSGSVPITPAQLRAAGYILVTDSPYLAQADGVTDNTTRINLAIQAGLDNFKPVWFPIDPTGAGRPYVISGTLYSYVWMGTSAIGVQQCSLVGASVDPVSGLPARPKIKCTATAPFFDNPATTGTTGYEPMLAVRTFEDPTNSLTPPSNTSFDPLTTPAGWQENTGNNGFGGMVVGIDFDTNNHAGAAGVFFPGAQSCQIQNITVTATNSFAGFIGMPNEGSASVSIKVIGGQYGIMGGPVRNLGNSPSYVNGLVNATTVGLTLTGQTVACIRNGGYMGSVFCGFSFAPALGAKVIDFTGTDGRPGSGGIVLIDGSITMPTNVLAIDNTQSPTCNLNLHNVYINGTTSLINSGNGLWSGNIAWNQVIDYHCATSSTSFDGVHNFPTKSIIYAGGSNSPGTAATYLASPGSLEALVTINAGSSAAPSDLVTRHVPTLNQIDSGPYIDITAAPYNCVPATTTVNQLKAYHQLTDVTAPDCLTGITQALADAETAGHNRVFIPRGGFCVSNSVTQRANSKVFGVSLAISQVGPHASWVPTSGNPPVWTTVSNTEGTGAVNYFAILRPMNRGSPITFNGNTVFSANRFNALNWQLGRQSVVSGIYLDNDFESNGYAGLPRQIISITGTGGGRWYSVCPREEDYCNQDVNFTPIQISGTSQPLWIYGVNSEWGGKQFSSGPSPITNIDIVNSSNVRLMGLKREGSAPNIRITNSSNIALYGSGKIGNALATDVPSGNYPGGVYTYGSVDTASTNIMFAQWACFIVNTAGTQSMIYDQASGLKFDLNTQLCLYSKGALNDAAMAITTSAPTLNTAALPVAAPDSAPYTALAAFSGGNPANMPRNSFFTDSTGAKVMRMTDASFPLALSAGDYWWTMYTEAGSHISRPVGANKDTYWYIMQQFNSRDMWVCKYQRGVGQSAAPYKWSNPGIGTFTVDYLSACFSMLPGEESILYMLDRSGTYLWRYDVAAQALAPNALFPGGKFTYAPSFAQPTNPGWISTNWAGEWISWCANYNQPQEINVLNISTGNFYQYTNGTLLTSSYHTSGRAFKGSQLPYVVPEIGGSGTSIQPWKKFIFPAVGRMTAGVTRDNNYPAGHGEAGEQGYYTMDMLQSFYQLRYITAGAQPSVDGGAWTGTDTLIPNQGTNANNSVILGDWHPNMGWNQTGAATKEYLVIAPDNFIYSKEPSAGSWSVFSGSVYKAAITFVGYYSDSTRGVNAVVVIDGGINYVGNLTKAANPSAITAGTYYFDGVGTYGAANTLYVQMSDSSNPTGKILPRSLGTMDEGIGLIRQDGGDFRKAAHTFHNSVNTDYYHSYYGQQSPDGLIWIGSSNLGVNSATALLSVLVYEFPHT